MTIYIKDDQLKLIEKDPYNLIKIDNQYDEVCMKAIQSKSLAFKYVKEQTYDLCLAAVKNNGNLLCYVEDKKHDICLEAVKQNGMAILYVENPTNEMCLEAVKENGYAIQYIKNPTEEMKLEAVKQNGYAIKFIENPIHEICLAAVKQNPSAISNCKQKHPELCINAFLSNHNEYSKKYIQKGVEAFMKNNPKLENKIFYMGNNYYNTVLKNDKVKDYDILKLNEVSLNKLEDYLINKNEGNYFIIDSNSNRDMIQKISTSNNNLIILKEDDEEIDIQYINLANRVISVDELQNFEI